MICNHPDCNRRFESEHAMKCHYGKVHGSPTLICPKCGQEFGCPPSEVDRRVYCSRACQYKDMLDGNHHNSIDWVAKECEYCGIEFSRPPSIADAQRFCSMECFGEWQSENKRGVDNSNWKGGLVELECTQCGKIYEVKQKDVEISRFCSVECSHQWQSENMAGPNSPHWRGGCILYYGPNWQCQKRRARKRDNYTCQLCGISEAETENRLDVHHIVSFREFGYTIGENDNYRQANRLENLVTLCASCHRKVEHGSFSFP